MQPAITMLRALLPELAALHRVRLAHDWTFPQLTAAMRRAKFPVSLYTLYFLLERAPGVVRPRDRTLFKIRMFLKHERSNKQRRRRRAASTAPTASSGADA